MQLPHQPEIVLHRLASAGEWARVCKEDTGFACELQQKHSPGTVQCGLIDASKMRYRKKRGLIVGICNHKVLSLLRCGRLVYHLGLPYSFLHFQYVEEAIKIAYCENKCGNCSYTVFSCLILCIVEKKTGFDCILKIISV